MNQAPFVRGTQRNPRVKPILMADLAPLDMLEMEISFNTDSEMQYSHLYRAPFPKAGEIVHQDSMLVHRV